MNRSFFVVDKLNSVAFYCYSLVRVYFENSDYLMYYSPVNDLKCRIFTSKLIKNSDGNYVIVDISNDEKLKLSSVSQSIFVDLPKLYSDNVDINKLINDFCFNNHIVFSNESFNLNEQFFCSNSYLADSYLDYCNYVREFYVNILSRVVISPVKPSLVWNIPKNISDIKGIDLPDNINVLDNTVVTSGDVDAINFGINNQIIGLGNVDKIIPVAFENSNYVLNQDSIKNSTNIDYSFMKPFDFQISSDVSVNNSGFNYSNINNGYNNQDSVPVDRQQQIQSNKVKVLKKAGFASNSYIIIGTVCLILAAFILEISIILVKNL